MSNPATGSSVRASDSPRDLYIDLMKKCLTHSLWFEKEIETAGKLEPARGKWPFGKSPEELEQKKERKKRKIIEEKLEGKIWPQFAHTMIGVPRLNNLENCCRTVIEERIPGDFIETGVWRGGACIFMRSILKAYGVTDRTVWVADSFAGLPPPDVEKAPADKGDALFSYLELAISLETVQANFRSYGLLDEQVKFLKGWFKDTLPTARVKQVAVARLDGDMYESTMDGLVNLYPKLSVGGFLIVDDYHALASCKQAVADYREKNGITEPVETIDWTGAFWRRTR